MVTLLTQVGDSSSIFNALGISGQAFLIQLATFVLAFLVLRQWAFKPILKMLDERRKTIEGGLTLGETMRAKEVKFEAEVADKLHAARQEADRIVSGAEVEAKQVVQAAEETARKHAEVIVAEGKEQVRQTLTRERARLEKEVITLVSDVSE